MREERWVVMRSIANLTIFQASPQSNVGLKHGAYCAGCCWILMALLFVAGVMNLLWVAAIAIFILAEKVAPKGETLGRIAGAALIAAGIAFIGR